MPPDHMPRRAVPGAARHSTDGNTPRSGVAGVREVRDLTVDLQASAFVALVVTGLVLIFSPDVLPAAAAAVLTALPYAGRSCLRYRRLSV
ncbi:hypothetical protein [Streptomyces hesseae]|uniref:AI-2E family transporter n=1 Tax=Streptomyces hesseae TaxID=3075519 RepID=A0ABU2SL55_9ACTN|nr:hypothetical protein [Streptomyces sp. DSM 40473]MDT0449712.1 hypothetical protein [Streptomyces sp. DSM 40473]